MAFAGALLLGALAACSPQTGTESGAAAASADTATNTHPVSGLKVIPVTVETGDGQHVFRSEVAQSAAEQAKGLMFRTELGPDEGMIFPRQGDVASFWMKNTPLPLDIIFVGKDRRIINIAAQTTPYSLESVSALGPTSAVFEIPGGRAAELGIEPGDRVEW
ncbi:MAG: hypothetical protein CL953_06450 [Erythrobacteraceae bacterium]|nr:hypothetical protein [Erythrobacteraceae bacterium]|tara:strand:- start:1495 stop:1980 length:486 start_codon:yes stop_codon:yes gene_type:complete